MSLWAGIVNMLQLLFAINQDNNDRTINMRWQKPQQMGYQVAALCKNAQEHEHHINRLVFARVNHNE